MKKILFGIVLMASTTFAFAQSAFESAMTQRVQKINAAHTTEEFTALANDFIRIAEKEKTQWTPYYYAALATVQQGRMEMRTGDMSKLDEYADLAQKFLDRSMELSPENAENYIVAKMIHSLRMMVSPQTRFMTEGPIAAEYLAKAEKLDPNNPRISMLRAEDIIIPRNSLAAARKKENN